MKATGILLALVVFAYGCNKAAEDAPTPESGKSTSNQPTDSGYAGVQAILTAKCIGCHGEKGKDGIDLRTHESIMKGGSPGAIVVAGDPAGSLIVKALRGLDGVDKMPKMAPPLDEADIQKVEAWIKAGAKS